MKLASQGYHSPAAEH